MVLLWMCVEVWHGREEIVEYNFYFISFAQKKYSCSFIKLRLNHWCHMDFFNNVLTTFLHLEHGRPVAVYEGSESSRI